MTGWHPGSCSYRSIPATTVLRRRMNSSMRSLPSMTRRLTSSAPISRRSGVRHALVSRPARFLWLRISVSRLRNQTRLLDAVVAGWVASVRSAFKRFGDRMVGSLGLGAGGGNENVDVRSGGGQVGQLAGQLGALGPGVGRAVVDDVVDGLDDVVHGGAASAAGRRPRSRGR